MSDEEKNRQRAQWKKIAPPSPANRETLSRQIREHVQKRPEYAAAETVAIYFARPFEVDLLPLWSEDRDRFVFPRCVPETRELEFYYVESIDQLVLGYGGITEPEPLLCAPAHLGPADLVLVPGLAFDRYGGRLGSGAGFYDRFLGAFAEPPQKWAVCFSSQISKRRLAQSDTDVRMDAVCSELGVEIFEKLG